VRFRPVRDTHQVYTKLTVKKKSVYNSVHTYMQVNSLWACADPQRPKQRKPAEFHNH
jgi:hypothetical protein